MGDPAIWQSDGTISIHAPREGGDVPLTSRWFTGLPFQSTPPARGATFEQVYSDNWWEFQSTPPARGATVSSIPTPPTT